VKPRVYLESSIFGYLVGWLNQRDLLVAANQQLTREWWARRRHKFELFAAQAVIDEIMEGHADRAADRLALLKEVTILRLTAQATALSEALLLHSAMPAKARVDALHIAIAATSGLDYLLTWNCKHIANARILPTVYSVCSDAGYDPPLICTPQELIEEPPHA
jgi:hypothetical protein